jgi:histidinol-phosphate/aromatic aminotransferase/cobyric acid decarboxylase-like protein
LLVRPFDDEGINGGVRVTISEGAANNNFLAFAAKYRTQNAAEFSG